MVIAGGGGQKVIVLDQVIPNMDNDMALFLSMPQPTGQKLCLHSDPQLLNSNIWDTLATAALSSIHNSSVDRQQMELIVYELREDHVHYVPK